MPKRFVKVDKRNGTVIWGRTGPGGFSIAMPGGSDRVYVEQAVYFLTHEPAAESADLVNGWRVSLHKTLPAGAKVAKWRGPLTDLERNPKRAGTSTGPAPFPRGRFVPGKIRVTRDGKVQVLVTPKTGSKRKR